MESNNPKNVQGSIDDSIRSLTEVGLTWARHGLTIGRSAVEASATTLTTVAGMLGELSTRLETNLKQKSEEKSV